MRSCLVGLLVVLVVVGVAAAEERERGFLDVYGGVMGMLESDVPEWKFFDSSPVIGGRVGVWIGNNWGVTLRTWYFQTDAKERAASPSDLAFLGVSLEVLARWRLDERWTVYGSLGPAMAVNTLDIARNTAAGRATEEDARSVAPGASGAVGIETGVLPHLRMFAETQASLVYPVFHFSDRTMSPRLLTIYGLVGARIPF